MIYREKHPDVHQEPDSVPVGRLFLVAFAALGISAILTVGSAVLLYAELEELRPSGLWPEARMERREFPIILQDLFAEIGPGQWLELQKAEELTKYRWIDKAEGRVGLPIDVAMELVVEEGR
ncbi:MAG TPA: hypothetical protein VLS89_01945 [Candidatus Nanopelagicales bacterium]|nr:hypothetical protein [Candidatus Nanopelagicales bacterium]